VASPVLGEPTENAVAACKAKWYFALLMTASATVSSKNQIVIPKEIREGLSIESGDQVSFMWVKGSVRFVKARKASEIRGICRSNPLNYEDVRRDRDENEADLDQEIAHLHAK
jgi:AbrB family looped-hinge helix DNA binding protein